MHQQTSTENTAPLAWNMSDLMDCLARSSTRPRYAFMVLDLIAKVAGPSGKAGPLVMGEGGAVPLRDWLCDALAPMAMRSPRRLALTERVRSDLEGQGALPSDTQMAQAMIEEETRLRVRASGKTNISRAVSDLVRAGVLRRHYQGYWVNHHNRGAQRQAVYTLTPHVCRLLRLPPTTHVEWKKHRQHNLPF